MVHYDSIEDFDHAPVIADNEKIRFDIRHVSGVRKLRRRERLLSLVKHPVALVILTWVLMTVLLFLEMYA
jgi:hypothetical protein